MEAELGEKLVARAPRRHDAKRAAQHKAQYDPQQDADEDVQRVVIDRERMSDEELATGATRTSWRPAPPEIVKPWARC
jgi:hypothetical protein